MKRATLFAALIAAVPTLFAALIAAVLLSGCFATQPISARDPKACATLPEAAQKTCNAAGQAFLTGEGMVSAINQTIKQNAESPGLFTKAELTAFRARVKEAQAKMDDAYDVFKNGDYTGALSQANLTNALLKALLAEVAREKAKESKQ